MNDDEKFDDEFMFIMHWTQEYPEIQEYIDREMNIMIELSGYKEANELIVKIKSKL